MSSSKEPLVNDQWSHSGARKRKNTKRWCKGVVGREHVPVAEINRHFADVRDGVCAKQDSVGFRWLACLHHEVCSVCDKELNWHPDVCPTTGESTKR